MGARGRWCTGGGAPGLDGSRLLNLLHPLPDTSSVECVDALMSRPGLRVERIVSLGQASPPGFWYDQEEGEWVLLLAGAARFRCAISRRKRAAA